MHPFSLEGLKSLTEEEPKPIFGLESEFYCRPACVCRIVQGDSWIVLRGSRTSASASATVVQPSAPAKPSVGCGALRGME